MMLQEISVGQSSLRCQWPPPRSSRWVVIPSCRDKRGRPSAVHRGLAEEIERRRVQSYLILPRDLDPGRDGLDDDPRVIPDPEDALGVK